MLFAICRDAEWNAAFNFSKNTEFLSECLQNTKGVNLVQLLIIYFLLFHW